MSRKDFHFDFNENADPVEEMRRLRIAEGRHFKTAEAFAEYARATPPPEVMLAELVAAIAQKNAKTARSRTTPAIVKAKTVTGKPSKRRRVAKNKLVHA